MRSPKEEAGLPQREQAWGALCRLGALEEQQVGHSAERLYRLAAISPARSPALNSMTLGHYFTFIVCCGASFSEWYPYWWFADEDWELCLSWSHFDFCSPNMLLEVRRMGTDGTGWGEVDRFLCHSQACGSLWAHHTTFQGCVKHSCTLTSEGFKDPDDGDLVSFYLNLRDRRT